MIKQENQTGCLNCGKCCHRLTPEGVVTREKCQYLVRLSNGKTLCRTYKTRIGKITHTNKNKVKTRCGYRTSFPFNIKGCGLNRPEWSDADESLWESK